MRTSNLLSAGILIAVGLAGCGYIEHEQRPARTPGAASRANFVPPAVVAPSIGEASVWPDSAPAIYAQSAILIDADTGKTLYQKNADVRRQVASTQKVLTALLVAERGGLDGRVTVQTADTQVEPTRLYVRPGQSYARRELLTAMMVKSCNDVAALLARDYAGSVPAFAEAMNQRAASLGATSSHFVNPHGLPGAQYSTARDMARIAYRAYRNPDLRSMMRLPGYTFRFADGRTKYLETTNKLLPRSLVYNGMKTGFTFAAGRCLITSASIGGRDLILVQLGSKTRYIFNDAERMMQWGISRPGSGLFAGM